MLLKSLRKYLASSVRLLPLFVLVTLFAACSSTPPPPLPPLPLTAPAIPPLSEGLKTEPQPSGAYWERVTKWRGTWDELLKSLLAK